MKRLLCVCVLFISIVSFSQKLSVANLSCENAKNPLGIETLSPSLSWKLYSNNRGVQQIAYHILIANDSTLLKKQQGNIWDSKKILSNQSMQIRYGGKVLLPAKTYYWKVMVWDNQKNVSAWSKISSWQMGLIHKEDWKGAKWIAYEELPDSMRIVPAMENRGPKTLPEINNILPLLRKSFTIKKPVKKASLFICGLGHFEASLNGKKIGDHFLDPGWSAYDKEALYVSFDVTSQLRKKENVLGVVLGNGFYFIPRDRRYRKLTGAFGYPTMISRLLIEYNDGSSQNIVSDESWKTSASPTTYTSIYGGEDYNANREQQGWNNISFDDSKWKKPMTVRGVPNLTSQMAEPMKVHEIFTPKSIRKITDSVYVFDLGQNASGIPQITVQGKKGDTVRIVPAELLRENGTANQRATGPPHYYDYILKGNGVETWQPSFTYYGFRYLQVERAVPAGENNPANLPIIHQLKGLHIRAAVPQTGSFSSSSTLFNKTHELINWGVKSNMASALTDCPHREKLGWLEQGHLMFSSLQYGYGVSNYLRKQVNDMMASQTANGLVPAIAPEYVKFDYGNGMFRDSPEWGSTSILLPWYMYQSYGDKELLNKSYPMMKNYLSYLQTKDSGYILSHGLGDWYDIGPKNPGLAQNTPMGITATAYYYYDLLTMQKIASLLQQQNDVGFYGRLADSVKTAFNKAFFRKDSLYYGTNSQTANAMALYMNLVPVKYKEAVLQNLIKDIRQRRNSITAGDIGFRYLLQALQNENRSDVIYDMNSRTDVPGYGYQLAKGATALTESWQALPTVSNNHLMLGHLMEWFYSGLGGLKQTTSSVAFKEIEINPQVVGDINFANISFESPYGTIKSQWEKTTTDFTLNVSIPANTTAIVYLPAYDGAVVTEGGRVLNEIAEVKVLGFENRQFKIGVGSGNYSFNVSTSEKRNDNQ